MHTVNIATESTTPSPMTTSDQQDETSTTQSTEPLDLKTTGSAPAGNATTQPTGPPVTTGPVPGDFTPQPTKPPMTTGSVPGDVTPHPLITRRGVTPQPTGPAPITTGSEPNPITMYMHVIKVHDCKINSA